MFVRPAEHPGPTQASRSRRRPAQPASIPQILDAVTMVRRAAQRFHAGTSEDAHMPGVHAHHSAPRFLVLILLVFSLIVPGRVAAWGSIAGSATHQLILDRAYALLAADPAFDPAVFPTLAEIQAHEGVNWFGTDSWFDYLVGPGPDSEGASQYSDHYYNPTTTEGDGPTAAAGQYVDLANGMAQANKDAAAKGAAWGAHYLADMYVPFHVVGASRDTVLAEYTRQGGAGASTMTLAEDVTGPVDLCYGCGIKDWSWFGADNFKTEVGRFLGIATPVTTGANGNSHLDWFDPWYYNGTWPASVKSSSHVVWEGAVTYPAAGAITGYDTRWQNAAPTFSNPAAAQQARVQALAVAAASETRINLVARVADDDPAINHAIQSAYTVWRASISALRPDVAVEQDPSAPGTYRVTAIVNNVATEAAQNVRVRLKVTGGEITGGDPEQPVTSSGGVIKTDKSIQWSVKSDKPSECSLTLEVIGSYAETPDLQYARVQKPLGQPEGSLDVIFCIDVTASMEDDIDSVKAAASSIVGSIAAKDPGFRVAVIAYRDWDDSEGLAMFHDFPFSSDRGAIVGTINSLSVGGGDDDPEAVFEVLMRAIDSRSVGGWRANVNKVVILMGDAPPHDPSRDGYTSAIVAKAAEDADPVVIQAVVVGNEGDFNTEAVGSFQALADLTRGRLFKAADASKVVAALEASIAVIVPAPKGADMPWLLVGVAALLLLLLVAGVVVMRSSRRNRPMLAATGSAGAGQAWSQMPPGSFAAVAPVPYAELLFAGAGDPAGARRYPLGPNQRLGQAPDSTIVLNDPRVAGYHAQIYVHGTAYAIADLGSATGTWVNGARIVEPTWLNNGDVVTVGPYGFTFRS